MSQAFMGRQARQRMKSAWRVSHKQIDKQENNKVCGAIFF
jgi:hypothetical protein